MILIIALAVRDFENALQYPTLSSHPWDSARHYRSSAVMGLRLSTPWASVRQIP